MTNRSFCLEDLQLDAKKQPSLSDKLPMTPQAQNSFQNRQGKEFLQLYIKARSKSRDLRVKNSPRSKSGKNTPRVQINDENRYNVASEPHSPNIAGNTLRKKGILKSSNTNYDLKSFTAEKPSQFKRNHEAETITKISQTEPQPCSIRLEHSHHSESFHYLESRDHIEPIHGLTSMEVLLPTAKSHRYRRSSDMIKPDSENTIQEEVLETEQEQQVQQGPETQIQNQIDENHQAIEIESNPQIITNSTTTMASNRIVFPSHIERAYKQILTLYAAWFLTYAVLLGLNFGFYPYYVAFIFAWGVEGYFIYSNFKAMKIQDDIAASRRLLNYNCYILSLALIQALAVIKFEGVNFPITLSMIPTTIITFFTCYLNSARNSRKSNSIITFIQTLITLQLISVGLKIDGYLFWSWAGVFWVGWASLVVTAFYAFGLMIMFLFYLCFEESSRTKSYQLAGLGSILLACCGYVATVFFLLAGFTSKLENGNDKNYIQFALLGGMAHVVFLSVLAFCARNKLKRFLQHVVVPPVQQEEENSEPRVRFEKATEGLPAYIVKFTPSYFLTFDESLKLKDEQKLRNMKKKVTLAKTCQYKRAKPENPLKLPVLSFKALSPLLPNILAKKFKTRNQKSDHMPLSDRGDSSNHKHHHTETNNTPRSEDKSSLGFKAMRHNFASEAKKKINHDEIILDTQDNDNDKICFSANDIDFVRKIEGYEFVSEAVTPTLRIHKETPRDKDDKTCIICYDKSADAVIMNCGHGGICYECALESWKKSQECFLCRAKIEKVLHIEANKVGKFNMTKVLSATKLVKEEPSNDSVHPESGQPTPRIGQQTFRSSLAMAMMNNL